MIYLHMWAIRIFGFLLAGYTDQLTFNIIPTHFLFCFGGNNDVVDVMYFFIFEF